MSRHSYARILLVSIVAFLITTAGTRAADPVVRAVLFYSPSGGHCHKNLSENPSASHPELVEGWLALVQSRTLRRAQGAQQSFRIDSKVITEDLPPAPEHDAIEAFE